MTSMDKRHAKRRARLISRNETVTEFMDILNAFVREPKSRTKKKKS